MAARLYANSTSRPEAGQPTAAAAPPAVSTKAGEIDVNKAEAALYGKPQFGVDGLDTTYAATQRAMISASVEQLGLEPGEAQAASTEWAGRFRQAGIASDVATGLTSVATGVLSGAIKVDPLAWKNAARAEMATEFGANADAALAAAREMVAADPPLQAWLQETGLGDHPRVVKAVARAAWAQWKAGKLRT